MNILTTRESNVAFRPSWDGLTKRKGLDKEFDRTSDADQKLRKTLLTEWKKEMFHDPDETGWDFSFMSDCTEILWDEIGNCKIEALKDYLQLHRCQMDLGVFAKRQIQIISPIRIDPQFFQSPSLCNMSFRVSLYPCGFSPTHGITMNEGLSFSDNINLASLPLSCKMKNKKEKPRKRYRISYYIEQDLVANESSEVLEEENSETSSIETAVPGSGDVTIEWESKWNVDFNQSIDACASFFEKQFKSLSIERSIAKAKVSLIVDVFYTTLEGSFSVEMGKMQEWAVKKYSASSLILRFHPCVVDFDTDCCYILKLNS